MKLNGKVALITGAASGIAHAIACARTMPHLFGGGAAASSRDCPRQLAQAATR